MILSFGDERDRRGSLRERRARRSHWRDVGVNRDHVLFVAECRRGELPVATSLSCAVLPENTRRNEHSIGGSLAGRLPRQR